MSERNKSARSVLRESFIAASILNSPGQPTPDNISKLVQFADYFDDAPEFREFLFALKRASTNGSIPSKLEIATHISGDNSAWLEIMASSHNPISLKEADDDSRELIEKIKPKYFAKILSDAHEAIQTNPELSSEIASHTRKALESVGDGLLDASRYISRSIGDLCIPAADDDPDELIQTRFLCRGGAMLIPAPSGIGKTVFALQMMLCFAVNRVCLGFRPARPLRSLYLQAENDDADLREIRDGIFNGLNFSPSEREQAVANVRFVTVDDKCGPDFIHECVGPLCRTDKPDLLWIDPLLSYIGGDISRQEVVSPWLRNHLNPVLHRHKVACILIHHTNKPPTGKEKANWQAGDFAYLGTGSAELANWPRAVVAIRSLGSHEVFELRLAKRGQRAGWKNADGSTCFTKLIGHATDGNIYWREADPEECTARTGRKAKFKVEDIMDVLGDQKLGAVEWQTLCKAEIGVASSTFYDLKKQAINDRLVAQSKLDNRWFKKP